VTAKKRTTSLGASLAVLVAACVLPLIVATGTFLYYDYHRARAGMMRDFVATAHSLAMAVDREFIGAERALRALSGSPYLAFNASPAFHDQARAVLPGHFISDIILLDSEGEERMNTALAFGEPPGPPAHGAQLAQLRRVLDTGQPDISDMVFAFASGKRAISLAVPVRRGQRVTHALVGVIPHEHLQKLLLDRRFSRDRMAVIADGSGTVVARTHEPQRFLGQSTTSWWTPRLLEAGEDLVETRGPDGPVVTVFVRSAASRWSVAVGALADNLTVNLRRSLWLLSGLALMLLAGGLAVAGIVGTRISRSIRALTTSALALGFGRTVSVPALPISEADKVGKAITKASTMLVEADTALASSEARLRGILESAMDAIITVDEQQLIVLYNRGAERIFGWSVEQVMGQRVDMLMPERFRAGHAQHLRSFADSTDTMRSKGARARLIGLRADGEEFPMEASISQVTAGGSQLYSVILRDVTVAVRAVEALERSNLDLQQFAYVASHDLKTPLRSIGGFVQLLERDHAHKLDDKATALIQRTSHAVQRLEQLTDDLLTYARVSSAPRPFALVDGRTVVDDAIQLLDAAIRETGAVVTVGELPSLLCDRMQLVQLMMNLIGNAIKYCSGRAPVVHVSAERREREWVFSVRDNGIGIEAKHHGKVFKVFQRLHSQQEYSGTGIGLAVCRRVVERHSGKIWLESTPGEGSTFHFSIPDIYTESTHS
jgi:PAS domain S-box-containing protein